MLSHMRKESQLGRDVNASVIARYPGMSGLIWPTAAKRHTDGRASAVTHTVEMQDFEKAKGQDPDGSRAQEHGHA
jgi:hypothetical protein